MIRSEFLQNSADEIDNNSSSKNPDDFEEYFNISEGESHILLSLKSPILMVPLVEVHSRSDESVGWHFTEVITSLIGFTDTCWSTNKKAVSLRLASHKNIFRSSADTKF